MRIDPTVLTTIGKAPCVVTVAEYEAAPAKKFGKVLAENPTPEVVYKHFPDLAPEAQAAAAPAEEPEAPPVPGQRQAPK